MGIRSIRLELHDMPALSDNHRGALLMAGAMVGFTVNDAFIKLAAEDLPLFEVLFLRGLGTTLILGLVAWGRGWLRVRPRGRDGWLVLFRSLGECGAAWFFLTALVHMEIANISAIMQALPLTVTLAAALFLGEPVGWRRISAIVVGFLGVLLIVRPGGETFNVYSVLALGAVVCVTVRDLAARRMSAGVPSVVAALAASGAITIMAAVGAVAVEWQPLGPVHAAWVLGAIGCVVVSYILSVAAMRVGEIGAVAPFRYTSLLAAIAIGAAVFGTFPDALTLSGAALVVASGLSPLSRERRRATV